MQTAPSPVRGSVLRRTATDAESRHVMLLLIMAVVVLALVSLGVMSIAAVVANAARAESSAFDGGAGASDAPSPLYRS